MTNDLNNQNVSKTNLKLNEIKEKEKLVERSSGKSNDKENNLYQGKAFMEKLCLVDVILFVKNKMYFSRIIIIIF